MNFQTPHEKFCFETATHFTAVRGRTESQRTNFRFCDFQEAIDYASTHSDGRTMIYAVNVLGNSAHICNA
tara:strand:- start:1799 stop:2008 length:210 start_codon:yes stop_codon:yes gene_type:complete